MRWLRSIAGTGPRCVPSRVGFCLERGVDPEDVVQDTLMRVWTNPPSARKTTDDLEQVPVIGLQDASGVERVGRLVAGITVRPRAGAKLTIDTLHRRYVIVDVSDERRAYATFLPDVTHSGATVAHADATIDLRDGRIQINDVLPTDGVIRVRNRGTVPHHALAIRLGADTTVEQAKRALRAGRSPEQVGAPADLMGLVSAGASAQVERWLRPGRYVIASFYAGTGPNAKPDVLRGLLSSTRVR